MQSLRTQPTLTGLVGVCCAVLGLLSWIAYGACATRGIDAVISRESKTANRMVLYAEGFRVAQLFLGVLSVYLGWIASSSGKDSRLARTLAVSGICLGVLVLTMLMLLV